MNRPGSLILTGLLVLAVASRSGHAQVTAGEAPATVAGCYELSLGSWSRPLGVNAAYHKLPLSVRLDTVGAARGGWVLRPDIAYPSRNRFLGTPRWTATADSVVMTWSNGFQSTSMRVARRPNGDLIGEAVVGSDANEFGNDLPRAAVVARRTACTEAELPLAMSAAAASAQQPPDSVARPTYERAKGPVVAFDDAHKTTHPYASGSRGLVRLLEADGYRVRPLTEAVSDESLRDVDVLIVANPGGWEGPDASLNDGEVSALLQWVRRGGSLLLILDHMPAPQNAARLTAALGVPDWHNGYAMVDIPNSLPAGYIIFWRTDSLRAGEPAVIRTGENRLTYQGADAVLAEHPITEGRRPDERVQRVATFVGSAFRPPEGAEALMVLPRGAISLMPATPAADVRRVGAPTAPVGEWLQGAVLTIGTGRIALFGEIGMFSGGPAPDNRKFVLNVMRWLTGSL